MQFLKFKILINVTIYRKYCFRDAFQTFEGFQFMRFRNKHTLSLDVFKTFIAYGKGKKRHSKYVHGFQETSHRVRNIQKTFKRHFTLANI